MICNHFIKSDLFLNYCLEYNIQKFESCDMMFNGSSELHTQLGYVVHMLYVKYKFSTTQIQRLGTLMILFFIFLRIIDVSIIIIIIILRFKGMRSKLKFRCKSERTG